MKKIGLISLLALLVGIVILGCGGNSKLDPIPPIPTNGYELTNVTTPFLIGFAAQEKDFQVQLLKDGLPVSGETVMTVSLPDEYGFIAETSVATNDGGYAVFHYTAADPLVDGLYSLALIHNDEDNISTIAYLDINMQDGSIPFEYRFINVTSPVNIAQAGQRERIGIELVDKDNNPVVGQIVSITPPGTGYGSIDPRSTRTDTIGAAYFDYTAPNDLRGLTSTTLTISFTERGNTITQNIEIVFQRTEYQFENPSTPILINQAEQTEEISAYLIDENNKPVSGRIVNITPLDSRYGTIDPLQNPTDSNGKATFSYIAPSDIRGLSSTTATISFTDEFDHTITQNIEIRFNNQNSYQLINAKNPYNINSATEPTIFDIQLIDQNGLPVLDARPCETPESTVTVDCVIPHSIDRSFGRFEGIYTDRDPDEPLDVDGYVYYRYLAPSPDDKADNGEETTFTVVYIDQFGNIVAESEQILLRMRY